MTITQEAVKAAITGWKEAIRQGLHRGTLPYDEGERSVVVMTAALEAALSHLAPAQDGIEVAIRWIEKRHADYVEEHGSYDPSTNVTEFPDGGEYEGELLEIIEGLQSLRSKQAPTVAVREDPRVVIEEIRSGKRHGFLNEGGSEDQWVADMENACPHCGGSGHKDDVVALAEQREAPVEAVGEGWRDISSAPKQHGHMILSTNRYGVVDTICWNNTTEAWDDGFYSENQDFPSLAPTLWQPVPDLPAAPEKRER